MEAQLFFKDISKKQCVSLTRFNLDSSKINPDDSSKSLLLSKQKIKKQNKKKHFLGTLLNGFAGTDLQ